ncbi:MAG: putative motility protein [Rhodospirillales bacterium]|nr:putative motility protein [Rhodospirillales bacterium]
MAQQAMLQQAVALSVMKQSADMQQQLASVLEQAILDVPVAEGRGANVDIAA